MQSRNIKYTVIAVTTATGGTNPATTNGDLESVARCDRIEAAEHPAATAAATTAAAPGSTSSNYEITDVPR
jgi:hypothetical protein